MIDDDDTGSSRSPATLYQVGNARSTSAYLCSLSAASKDDLHTDSDSKGYGLVTRSSSDGPNN